MFLSGCSTVLATRPFRSSKLIGVYNATLDSCQLSILPKGSLLSRGEHALHQSVYDLSAMVGGGAEAA
jgi:hypothetical protein